MPILEEEGRVTREDLDQLRRTNKCKVCGERLDTFLDRDSGKVFLACHNWPTNPPTSHHEGIEREYQPQDTDSQSDLRGLVEMEQKVGLEKTRALAKLPAHGQLTQTQAEHILGLVYPGVPKDEVIRCAILCRDFGLHPLMKEVYIIPFGQGDKRTWSTVIGIGASRKMAADKKGAYSFLDGTPRAATPEEIIKQFGKDSEEEKDNLISICKLKGEKGNEAEGFGLWPKDKTPYGLDKGNTKRNMANIRSERPAYSRLPGETLPQLEVIDEAYVEVPNVGKVETATGEIKEGEDTVAGEWKEVPKPEEAIESIHGKEVPVSEAIEAEEKVAEEPKDETPVTEDELAQLDKLMVERKVSAEQLGKYIKVDKGWAEVKTLPDLKKWQFTSILEAFKKGKE